MPNNCYRCPNCGNCRLCGRPLADAASGAANGACPSPRDPLARELYQGRALRESACATCYDPLYGCQQFPENSRNRFWPGFCHPRWLYCRDLYNCR